MTKNSESFPNLGTPESQVVDIIEPTRSQLGNDHAMMSSVEVIGSVKAFSRMRQFSEATLIIDLARVQDAFNDQGDMVLNTPASSFKEFVEELGYPYKTILNKVGLLRRSSPQVYQLFDRLGLPASLHQRVTSFPPDVKEKALALLSDPAIESADQVKETVRGLYEAYIVVKDQMDEASMKEKAELIVERDQANQNYESIEDVRQNLSDSLDKEREKTSKLKGELDQTSTAVELMKVCKALESYLKLPEQTEDPDQQAVNLKFRNLIMSWEERVRS